MVRCDTGRETVVAVKDLTFRYEKSDDPVLSDLSLSLDRGEFVLLTGFSGCGKSTLLKTFNGVIPHIQGGDMSGQVVVCGLDTTRYRVHTLARHVGMVFQNPEDQIFSLRVVDEVAFGVENQGLSHQEIVERVDSAMALTGISPLRESLTFALSGGQKQKVSIAANIAMRPEVLVLDDPTTDLDPLSKFEVVRTLAQLREQSDTTILVAEHDLGELVEVADRLVVMDRGRVVADGPLGRVMATSYDQLVGLGIRVPDHLQLACLLNAEAGVCQDGIPVRREDVLELVRHFVSADCFRQNRLRRFLTSRPPQRERPQPRADAPVVMAARDLRFSYDRGTEILHGINVEIRQGEFVAIVGHNGSGKTTFTKLLVGLLRPTAGTVYLNGVDSRNVPVEDMVEHIGYVFQNPDNQLFTGTVRDEIMFGLKRRGVPEDEARRRLEEALSIVGLTEAQSRHPFSLSRGQRQRLAVATTLVTYPSIILLDEPTTGQDRTTLEGLLDLMQRLIQEVGATVIMVTHDMDIVAEYATRVLVFRDGNIELDGTPEEVFLKHNQLLNEWRLNPPVLASYHAGLGEDCFPPFLTYSHLEAAYRRWQETG